jgi:hypothetical protein
VSREWEERQHGLRPVVQNSPVSCYSKEFGTSNSSVLGIDEPLIYDCERIEGNSVCIDGVWYRSYDEYAKYQINLKKSQKLQKTIKEKNFPFVLPGLGIRKKTCGAHKIDSLCSCGEGLGVTQLFCKSWECPNCASTLEMQHVFDLAVKIEALVKVTGERPASIIGSTHPELFKGKDWEFYDTFHKRFYRHCTSVGINGGLRIFHPYRILGYIKELLRKKGYGVAGRGFWNGVREDALGLGDWRKYVYLAPHDHAIVFPSWIEEHKDSTFLLKKIDYLATPEDTVRALRYLISHMGLLNEDEDFDNHPMSFFGELHRWKPENYLTEAELSEIKHRIADIMHITLEEDLPEELEEKCNCGACKKEFIPINAFAKIEFKEDAEIVTNSILNFPAQYHDFWKNLVRTYNAKINDINLPSDERVLFLDDIEIPEGIRVLGKREKSSPDSGSYHDESFEELIDASFDILIDAFTSNEVI